MKRFCLVLLSALGLAACRNEPEVSAPAPAGSALEASPFRNATTDVAFVGDAACFDCHEDQYVGYQEHGMAHSFYPLDAETRAETWPSPVVYHAPSGYYYQAVARGGRFYQVETRRGPGGRETHRLEREIRYVVGSGSAARTYLAEQNGRLYQMPLTYYTQTGTWDLSPGYRANNSRFDRLVPDRCMACHNSYPEPVAFAEGKYAAVPHGIGCERCHGPGALHVEARLADPDAGDSVDYTIVNPAHLALDRRLDVCQQCHLHGAASLLEEGRTAYDFRPSQALPAYLSLYTQEATDEEAISVISHAERMQASRCFIETVARGGSMDCTTCHDPHAGFRDAGPAYFNTTCQTCHAPETLPETPVHTAEADCAGCHMPKVEAVDAPHASFTDHKVRVVEAVPEPAPSVGRGLAAHPPVVLEPYFEADRADPDFEVERALAYIVYGRQEGRPEAVERGVRDLRVALQEQPEHGEGQFILGYTLLQQGQTEEAVPPLEAAVRADANVPERLNALAQAYEAEGIDPLRVERLYRRALAIQPALADVRLNYGRFLEMRGRLDEAVAAYRTAVEEQPWLAAAHYNLGTAYLQRGETEAARRSLRQALHLDPGYVEAWGNLGLLYATGGQPDSARAAFQQAVDVAPESAVALGNLGTFYLNEGEREQAIDLLRRAVAADPAYLDGHLNLGIAFVNAGRLGEARRHAERAYRLAPGDPRVQQLVAATR